MPAKRKEHSIDNTYGSPRWSGEILDCSMPMTFDQYDHCSGNCLYCFSYFQKALKSVNPLFPNQTENYQHMEPRSVNIQKVKGLFSGDESQFSEYIDRGIAMQWGGLSDPFDKFEKKYKVGLELLRFFKRIQYQICFSTKFTWWVDDSEYITCFEGNKNFNTKFSIINLNTDTARAIEQGIPSPEMRLKAVSKLSKLNTGGVTLRLRPFIIGMSDKNDEYLALIARAAEAGATAVSTEFFCLERRGATGGSELRDRYNQMSEAIGFDLVDFYSRNSTGSGYLRLNWKIKEPYVDKMEKLCKQLGMRFYVSDAHHKDRCHNGSCCGLGEGWNYQRGQFTEMLVLARQRYELTGEGLVYWCDMEKHISGLFDFGWRRAAGFNTSGTRTRTKRWNQTMYEYIREIWNSPNNGKSPYKYFQGLLYPERLDECGDVIYRYKPYEHNKTGS